MRLNVKYMHHAGARYATEVIEAPSLLDAERIAEQHANKMGGHESILVESVILIPETRLAWLSSMVSRYENEVYGDCESDEREGLVDIYLFLDWMKEAAFRWEYL